MTEIGGRLVLVVGPSGAGKDSVIDGAKAALEGDSGFVFVRRTITRPADAGGELHTEMSTRAFDQAKSDGAFSLSWKAHGFDYGIPVSIEQELSDGRCVVANVSRSVLHEARERYPGLCIVNITAPTEILAQRIASRGREDMASIVQRVRRATQHVPAGADVITLENTGALADSVSAFLAVLTGGGTDYRSAAST